MQRINVDTNNAMLRRYYDIKYYYRAYKNDGLTREEYENLKTQLLNLNYWKTLVYKLPDRKYDIIITDALIILAELFNDDALTITEFQNELQKIRIYKPRGGTIG